MRYPLDFGDLKTLKTFIQNVVNKDAVQVFIRDCKFVDPYVAEESETQRLYFVFQLGL